MRLYAPAIITEPINVPRKLITIKIRGSNGLIVTLPVSLCWSASIMIPPMSIKIIKIKNATNNPTNNPINVLKSVCRPLGCGGVYSKAWDSI